MITLTFEETMDLLLGRHSTTMQGNEQWVDWDAVYADLLEEGWQSGEASELLDAYIEKHGY